MQLLKSLICFQGYDNRSRFFAIGIAVFIFFIIFSSAFSNFFIIALLTLMLLTAILSLTTIRRLHDARLSKNWCLAPSLTFFIVGIIILLVEHDSSYWLLMIPAICAALLLTYPSTHSPNQQKKYILGYFGPVDLSDFEQETHNRSVNGHRIEPTLATENATDNQLTSTQDNQPPSQDQQRYLAQQAQSATEIFAHYHANEKQATENSHQQSHTKQKSRSQDIGEIIRLKLLDKKHAKITIITTIAIALVAVLISWLSATLSSTPLNNEQKSTNADFEKTQASEIIRLHQLTMPDNFSLYLSTHQGVIINWQADEVLTPLLWSQTSAQGDDSCQTINFGESKNKKHNIRPLSVTVENKNNYFATFSPIDSQALVQSLAFKGGFSLCGYSFSLKGSQAAIGKNQQYVDWLEY
ncbi:MAG: hypothetical protein OCD00_11620 [Colwellia sp.]